MSRSDSRIHVVHVVDALTDAGPGLWGKERAIAHLLQAQRADGRYVPSLAVFVDCSLAVLARERGFPVTVLSRRHARLPIAAARKLDALLRAKRPEALVHSHEYKANVVARTLRRTGTPMRALVSTSHGWGVGTTRALALYNASDRATARASDAISVSSSRMIESFARTVRPEFIANGLPDEAGATVSERAAARERFGFAADHYVVGYLARTSVAKGVLVVCEAAARLRDASVVWAVAGSGEGDEAVREASARGVRALGFVADNAAYFAAVDCFVQASYSEGLSLSLLEAMRAGVAIVATDVGSTRHAIRDGCEGLLVPPGDAAALAAAVRSLREDPAFARALGRAARERFVSSFSIERQVDALHDLYAIAMVKREKRLETRVS